MIEVQQSDNNILVYQLTLVTVLQALAHLAFNKPSSAQTLSCLLFNARSLCNKLFEFHYILYNNDHVIIMIIETWLTPESVSYTHLTLPTKRIV